MSRRLGTAQPALSGRDGTPEARAAPRGTAAGVRTWRRALHLPGCSRARTNTAPPLLPRSVMLVGWGGNNGTTVTGGILANKQ